MQFINTRPDQRAKTLSLFLRQHGIEVIELPLLTLVEKPLTVAERAVLQTIDRYQVVVLVSEAAVKYGLARLTTLVKLTELSNKIVWVAVGDKTANFLNKPGSSSQICQRLRLSFPMKNSRKTMKGY